MAASVRLDGAHPTSPSSVHPKGDAVASINTMRAVLVGGAVVAALIAAAYQLWVVVGILLLGILAHAALWWHLHRHVPPVEEPPR